MQDGVSKHVDVHFELVAQLACEVWNPGGGKVDDQIDVIRRARFTVQ